MHRVFACLLLVACAEDAASPEPVPSEPLRAEAPAAVEAPAAEWVDVDAESVQHALRSHPSRHLLVNVWSTWCEPCVEEMPDLVRTARRYESRGLGLVLIAAEAPGNRDAAHRFLVAQGAPMPSWFKVGPDDAFIRALHAEWSGGLPATLLLDERRRVVHFWEDPVSAESLQVPIEALLGGEG